jgi:hypothetical protein
VRLRVAQQREHVLCAELAGEAILERPERAPPHDEARRRERAPQRGHDAAVADHAGEDGGEVARVPRRALVDHAPEPLAEAWPVRQVVVRTAPGPQNEANLEPPVAGARDLERELARLVVRELELAGHALGDVACVRGEPLAVAVVEPREREAQGAVAGERRARVLDGAARDAQGLVERGHLRWAAVHVRDARDRGREPGRPGRRELAGDRRRGGAHRVLERARAAPRRDHLAGERLRRDHGGALTRLHRHQRG